MATTKPPTTRIPADYQMPTQTTIKDGDGKAQSVVDPQSLTRILFRMYNLLYNPPASTTTNVTTGAPGTNFADNEVPSNPSGDNMTFSILHSPNPQSSLSVFVNKGGAGAIPYQNGVDYTLNNNVITLKVAISGAYTGWVNYRY